MLGGVAAPLVVALALHAGVEGEVGLRAESRGTAYDADGARTEMFAGWLVAGRARVTLEVPGLRLGGSYAGRLWTSDVRARPTPVGLQEVAARVETHHAAPWTAALEAGGARGRTDPLADPWQAAQRRGALQAAPLAATPFDAVRGLATASVPFDLRTTLAATATAWRSGGTDDEARIALPTQRGVMGELSLAHLASPRDTLRLQASATATRTALAGVDPRSAGGAATATWRRRLTPAVTGWLGAGAAVAEDTVAGATPDSERERERTWFAVGETGLAYEHPVGSVEARASVEPYVDRLAGDSGPMASAALALRHRFTPRLSLSATAYGGTRPAGRTRLAAGDVTLRYALRERLHLDLGVAGRLQRERRPELPSYSHASIVAGVAWETGTL